MLNIAGEIELTKQVAKEETEVAFTSEPGNPFVPGTTLIIDKSLDYRPAKILPKKTQIAQSILERQLMASRKELDRNPSNPYLLNNLGLSLLNANEIDEAVTCFKKALEYNANFVGAKFNLAKAYIARGMPELALEIYSALLMEQPDNQVVHSNISEVYLLLSSQERSQRSRSYLEHAKQQLDSIENKDAATENTLGLISSLIGDKRQAVAHFRRAIASDPRSSLYHFNLGAWYLNAKNYKKASLHFSASLSLDGGNLGAVKNLARCYLELGHAEKASDLLKSRASFFLEEDIEFWTLLALAAYSHRKYQLALDYLFKLLKIVQKMQVGPAVLARTYNNIGCAYEGLNDTDKAEEYFVHSISVSDSEPEAFFNLAFKYLLTKRYAKSEGIISFIERAFPSEKRLPYLKARYYFHLEDFERAVSFLEKAMIAQPDNPDSYATMSYVYCEVEHDFERAIECVKKGLRHNPTNLALLNNLAYYLIMNEDVERGRQVLDCITAPEAATDTYLNATRGLLLIKQDNLDAADKFYRMAQSQASSKEIRSQVRQKYNLELGRYWMAKGKWDLSRRYLQAAINIETISTVFLGQARKLLGQLPSVV